MSTNDEATRQAKSGPLGIRIPMRSFILLTLFPILLGLLALLYFVSSRQIDIRQECQYLLWSSFPKLMEQQRTAVNLERLRMMGNTIYNSADHGMRRKARIEAQALNTDAAFEGSPKVRESIALAYEKLRDMSVNRDKQRVLRLQLLASFSSVAQIQEELTTFALEQPKACAVWPLTNITPTFLDLLGMQDARVVSNGEERLQLLLNKINVFAPSAGQCVFPEGLKNVHERLEKHILQFLHSYQDLHTTEKKLTTLWQEFDITLRGLSDYISLNASVGIEKTLHRSIEMARDVERITWQGFMLLCVFVILGFFLLRAAVYLPLVWLIRAITSVNEGKGLLPAPRICIKELQNFADAIANLNCHWTGVKAHSAKLESEKLLLEGLSLKDALTDLHNRRYFDLMLTSMWDEALVTRRPIALLMMDIDHFKRYNDTLGHPQGDACLKDLAQAFSSNILRPTDKVCRYGGEEFVLLLNCNGVAAAMRVAERLHQGVHDLKITHPDSPVNPFVTLTIGVVCHVPEAGESASMLVDWADKALYVAKNGGRNCTGVCTLIQNEQGEKEEQMEVVTYVSPIA